MHIDASSFPFVRMGYDPSRDEPMDIVLGRLSELLRGGKPFVFLSEGDFNDGGGEGDRRNVSLWMKANKAEIVRLIKGLVHVEPDAAKRAAAEQFSEGFAKFWGYPMAVVATHQDAQQRAEGLLAR
ncbi:hypothetical protein [Burkholderia stagnalis]